MPFKQQKDPAQKLVQMNVAIPWSLSNMVDQVAAARKAPKTQVIRDALHDGIMRTPEMVEMVRNETRASQ